VTQSLKTEVGGLEEICNTSWGKPLMNCSKPQKTHRRWQKGKQNLYSQHLDKEDTLEVEGQAAGNTPPMEECTAKADLFVRYVKVKKAECL
jgi:hypothetical protein